MAKKPAVKIFDPKKDITIITDANEYSIYLSRRLTNTEFNYSNIEKEAFAVVWTTTRARQFLIEKKFV